MWCHENVIKWEHFPRYWPFVRGIHRSPANSPHKGHWPRALLFSLSCARTSVWESNRDAGDLRRHCAHYDVNVMYKQHTYVPDHWNGNIFDLYGKRIHKYRREKKNIQRRWIIIKGLFPSIIVRTTPDAICVLPRFCETWAGSKNRAGIPPDMLQWIKLRIQSNMFLYNTKLQWCLINSVRSSDRCILIHLFRILIHLIDKDW